MNEVLNVLICNTMLEQYTVYNMPIIYPEEIQPVHVRALQEFEKLYDRYLSSPNKKDLMIKKVYQIDTFALLATGNYVIMAKVAHNRTEKEAFDVLRNLNEDIKVDEESSFIFSWV